MAFAGFFVVASVSAYITDTRAVVATARDADLRGLVVDVIEESLEQEISSNFDERFRSFVTSGARVVIGRAMTDEWFYGVLETAYGGLVEVIDGGQDETLIDLADRKRSLRDSLLELGESSLQECAAVTGAAPGKSGATPSLVGETPEPPGSSCQGAAAATRIRDRYRNGVRDVIAAIPTETNLTRLIETLGPRFLPPSLAEPDAARRAGSLIGWVKWLLLAAAVLLLTVVVIANATSPARVLGAAGAVLIAAALLYLLAAHYAGHIAEKTVRDEFASQLARYGPSDSVVAVAGEGAERTARAAIRRALGMKGLPLVASVLVGFAGVAGAIVIQRRR